MNKKRCSCIAELKVLWAKAYMIISLQYGLAFIVNPEWKNTIYKQGKADERIPVKKLNT